MISSQRRRSHHLASASEEPRLLSDSRWARARRGEEPPPCQRVIMCRKDPYVRALRRATESTHGIKGSLSLFSLLLFWALFKNLVLLRK